MLRLDLAVGPNGGWQVDVRPPDTRAHPAIWGGILPPFQARVDHRSTRRGLHRFPPRATRPRRTVASEGVASRRVRRALSPGGEDPGPLPAVVASGRHGDGPGDSATVYDNSRIEGPRIVAQLASGTPVGAITWPTWAPSELSSAWPDS